MIGQFTAYVQRNKLGTLALTLCLSYMFLGLPAQIIQIWQTHDVKSISGIMFSLLTAQSIGWVAYGIQKKDWFVTIPNIFGTLFIGTIVVEWLMFR